MHVDRESAYVRGTEAGRLKNDQEWVRFLSELGGKRGTSFGVSRLMRDARGEVLFPLEPSIRLNAVSPIHARMTGISSGDVRAGATSGGGGGGRTPRPQVPPSSAGAAEASDEALAAPVIVSIFKRCWSPGGIGVAVPPGLDVSLPGTVPPAKVTEQYTATLTRLVLHGGIPAAFRAAVWYELSGAHAKAALHPPGYYAQLCSLRPPPDAAYAISKDLDRTFPGHSVYDKRAGTDALKRLLGAFRLVCWVMSSLGVPLIAAVSAPHSLHNADIGYCQGLNFVAGFLLVRRIRAASCTCHRLQLHIACACCCSRSSCSPRSKPSGYSTSSRTRFSRKIITMEGWSECVLRRAHRVPASQINFRDGRAHLRLCMLQVHADQRVLAHLVSEVFPDISEVLAEAGIEISVRRAHVCLKIWGVDQKSLSSLRTQVVSVEWRVLLQQSRHMCSCAHLVTVPCVVVRSLPPFWQVYDLLQHRPAHRDRSQGVGRPLHSRRRRPLPCLARPLPRCARAHPLCRPLQHDVHGAGADT